MFLPLPDSFLCPGSVFSREVKDFGRDGRDGRDGSRGEGGRDGESRTIFVDGSELFLNLSGEDGGDGEDGDDGDDARFCQQGSRDDRDQKGAHGGDGGDGGRGGSGGDGGSLTLYYTNIEDLKKMYVIAAGGSGGSGGRQGYGGEGCECRERDWDARVCSGSPGSSDYRCETRRFVCRDGDDGDDGRSGNVGSSGQLGKLNLIQGTEELPPEEWAIARPFSELTNQVFRLSRNFWETRRGAINLLGGDSIVDDEYRQFIERIDRSVEVVWNAERSPADFRAIEASLRLNDDKTVELSVPDEIWMQTTKNSGNDLTQFVISRAILESEVTNLRLVDVAENGQNLHLTLIDTARQSDVLNTEFEIVYETTPSAPRGRFDDNYKTRYEGKIPPEFVSLESHRFTVNIGRLSIDEQYLRGGLNIKIELRMIRSLGERSAEQKIEWRGAIRR